MKFENALNLNIPDNFGPDEDGDPTDSIKYIYKQLDHSVTTEYGASQFVIINKEWDEVIKIPFAGTYQYDDDDEFWFDKFQTNYCELTLEIYNKAETEGVASIFAKIRKLKENTLIYAQERVECSFYNSRKEYEGNSLDIVKEKSQRSYLWKWFCPQWLAKAVDCYGLDFVDNFLTFCNKNDISDLHTENYGYRPDGTPVIFDYSGFDW